MAAPFGQFTLAQIESSVQNALVALRNDLTRLQNIHAWLSAYSAGDFEGAPLSMPAADATAIFSAVADANGLAQLAFTGTDSRNPGAGYVYMSSVNAVAGPLS
jgi:hypothetical protein